MNHFLYCCHHELHEQENYWFGFGVEHWDAHLLSATCDKQTTENGLSVEVSFGGWFSYDAFSWVTVV